MSDLCIGDSIDFERVSAAARSFGLLAEASPDCFLCEAAVESAAVSPFITETTDPTLELKRQLGEPVLDEECIFRQTSDGLWEVVFEGQKRVGLKNLKGMALIRRLLAHPGIQISAFELLAASGPASVGGATPDKDQIDDAFNEGALATAAPWTGIPTLDDQAKRELKAELVALREKRQSAQERNDQAEEEAIDNEVSAIKARLKLDLRPDGRSRLMGSDVEKFRQAASRRYCTALDHLTEQLPALAEHLKQGIRPGAKFVYHPAADITWIT